MLLTDISVRALKPTDRQRTYFDDTTERLWHPRLAGRHQNVRSHARSAPPTHEARAPRDYYSCQSAGRRETHPCSENPWVQHQPKTRKFGEAYELFKTEHVAKKKARTQYDYQRAIELYFLKELGSERLQDVTYETVTDITDKLADRPSPQAHKMPWPWPAHSCDGAPNRHAATSPTPLSKGYSSRPARLASAS